MVNSNMQNDDGIDDEIDDEMNVWKRLIFDDDYDVWIVIAWRCKWGVNREDGKYII